MHLVLNTQILLRLRIHVVDSPSSETVAKLCGALLIPCNSKHRSKASSPRGNPEARPRGPEQLDSARPVASMDECLDRASTRYELVMRPNPWMCAKTAWNSEAPPNCFAKC